MTLIERIESWGEAHHPKWMDIVRIGLGIFLVYQGVQFAQNYNSLLQMLPGWMSFGSFAQLLAGHYIVGAHILGGVLLVFGLITRVACLIQLPVLIGAIFFANYLGAGVQAFTSTFLAIVVFLLLLYFLAAGDGRWSMAAAQDEEEARRIPFKK